MARKRRNKSRNSHRKAKTPSTSLLHGDEERSRDVNSAADAAAISSDLKRVIGADIRLREILRFRRRRVYQRADLVQEPTSSR